MKMSKKTGLEGCRPWVQYLYWKAVRELLEVLAALREPP